MKSIRIALSLVLVALIGYFWWARFRPHAIGEAFVSDQSVTLWSTTAQVRQPLATLHYGEKVAILGRRSEQSHVRTLHGADGWVESRLLMEPTLWNRSAQLMLDARKMPVQARGRTKVPSNLRLEPGREGERLYRFARGVGVEVLSRAVAEWSAAGANEDSEDEQKPRREDWFLVRGLASPMPGKNEEAVPAEKTEAPVEVAGWVLGRFVDLDVPAPVRDLASSSGLRVLAWFELNRVRDSAGEKPQYLAAGVHGGEGQPCDFTMIRVYTWGARRRQYETAYVESNLCGHYPIRAGNDAAGEPEFRFAVEGKNGSEERHYVMRQTVVRRVRESERARPKAARKQP